MTELIEQKYLEEKGVYVEKKDDEIEVQHAQIENDLYLKQRKNYKSSKYKSYNQILSYKQRTRSNNKDLVQMLSGEVRS